MVSGLSSRPTWLFRVHPTFSSMVIPAPRCRCRRAGDRRRSIDERPPTMGMSRSPRAADGRATRRSSSRSPEAPNRTMASDGGNQARLEVVDGPEGPSHGSRTEVQRTAHPGLRISDRTSTTPPDGDDPPRARRADRPRSGSTGSAPEIERARDVALPAGGLPGVRTLDDRSRHGPMWRAPACGRPGSG